MIEPMQNITAEQAQKDTGKTHGYAVYTEAGYATWGMSALRALEHDGAVRVVNVQNGAYFELRNGELVNTVFADEVPAA